MPMPPFQKPYPDGYVNNIIFMKLMSGMRFKKLYTGQTHKVRCLSCLKPSGNTNPAIPYLSFNNFKPLFLHFLFDHVSVFFDYSRAD